MNAYLPDPSYFTTCQKCKCALAMDSYAIDTKSCDKKHTFFFKCPKCDGFSATAMANIPTQNWSAFIAADELDDVIRRYEMANSKF